MQNTHPIIEPLFTDYGSSTTFSTTLNEELTSSDTTISVSNASSFPSKGTITIGDEQIIYTGRSSNDLTGCVRGANSTTASSHSNSASVSTVARASQSAISTDKQKAGWYIDRLHNDKTLRISDSDMALSGVIKYNKNENKFQGFNGSAWVDFNATQGPAGSNGSDGIASFDVINLPEGLTVSGEVFAQKNGSDVQLRSLTGGTFDANAILTGQSAMTITKSSNYLTLTPQPQPYVWDMTATNNVAYFKSSTDDSTFKAFGTISVWKVKASTSITAGTIVRITLSVSGTGYTESTTELVIEPYTYSASQQEISEGSAILGVALQTKSDGESCRVCTEGITTIIMGDGNGAGNQTGPTVDGPGSYGFVGYDGKVYNETISTGISTNTPVAGYFLERGTFTSGEEVLFYVKSSFSMT